MGNMVPARQLARRGALLFATRRPAIAQLTERAKGAPQGGAQRLGPLALGGLDQSLELAHATELAPAFLDQPAAIAASQLDQGADDLAAQQHRGVVRVLVGTVWR